MQDSKIAIVGAGVSGLSAAVRLVRQGIRDITIYEARREAGGRTRSYVDTKTGDVLDNGQHLMMGCYRATLEYLHLIGSSHLLQRTPLAITFHAPNRRAAKLKFPETFNASLNLLLGLWNSNLLSVTEKIAAMRLGYTFKNPPTNLAGKNCTEVFRELHQPTGLIQKLWAPIIYAAINASPDEASAELFANLFREIFFSGRGRSNLLFPLAGLSELLIDPAIEILKGENITIRFSTPVREILYQDNRILIFEDGHSEEFDAVIYCGQTREVLPKEVQSIIPMIEYSPIVNAYFWLDRLVLEGPIHGFLGTTLQWIFPKQTGFGAQRLALTVSAASELAEVPNEKIRDMLWSDIQNAVPAIRETEPVHSQVIKEKRATPLLTPQVQQGRPANSTSIPGLFLGGDFVQNGLPATIEGAIRNGFAAGELVLQAITNPDKILLTSV